MSGPDVSPALSVRVVGPLGVRRDARMLVGKDIGSRKARILLALLAVHHARVVAVDRIVDVLWHDWPPRRPAQDVATLVSRLRTALGPHVVEGGRAGYRLAEGVDVDLYAAAALLDDIAARTADPDAAGVLITARQALALLDNGGVLSDIADADWAEPARMHHTVLLRRARHAVAEAALRCGQTTAAGDVAEAAVRVDSYDEAGCRLLMRAYHEAGEPARALIAYEQLRHTLARDLGIDPDPTTRDLHQAILRGNHPAARDGASAVVDSVRAGESHDLVGRDAPTWRTICASGTGGARSTECKEIAMRAGML